MTSKKAKEVAEQVYEAFYSYSDKRFDIAARIEPLRFIV
jgi:hypothetical protein